jgi:hypothetical protein
MIHKCPKVMFIIFWITLYTLHITLNQVTTSFLPVSQIHPPLSSYHSTHIQNTWSAAKWKIQTSMHVDSNGFWRWCTAHRITEFLDFFHRPVFYRIEKNDVLETWSVSKTSCFLFCRISDDGKRPKTQQFCATKYAIE